MDEIEIDLYITLKDLVDGALAGDLIIIAASSV